MPTWGTILREIGAAHTPDGLPDYDAVRLKYLLALHRLTGRAVISYASAWLKNPRAGAEDFSVEGTDVHGLMEVCHGVQERKLDLIIHSPGGSPDAAEQMLEYLRTRFDHIRAIVPLQAKSAATLLALGCDEIILGDHSELGPIDPQIRVPVPEGFRQAPAHAILRDFERAKEECARNPAALAAWTPILRGYSGGLIEFCNQQINRSIEVAAAWLERYMLSDPSLGIPKEERRSKARSIADFFGSSASYDIHRTHSRPIRFPELRDLGLKVSRLEQDGQLQDAVLSIYHATDITFNSPAVKIIENHNKQRYVRISAAIPVQLVPRAPEKGPQTAPPTAPPNRAERRRHR